MNNESLMRLTVPIFEEPSAASIVVPIHGLAVSNPADGLFYGLAGSDFCKAHYKAAAQWAASRTGAKIATVEIGVTRPKELNVPLAGLDGIFGLPVLHTRYMKRADKDELACLCQRKRASMPELTSRKVDWDNVVDGLLVYPEISPMIFRALNHLKILVVPMRTVLMSEPVLVAAVRIETLFMDVRSVAAVCSTRNVVHPKLRTNGM